MNQNLICKIISHRGLCKINPSNYRVGENTIPAFEAGIKILKDSGYPQAIEFDVRLTKDGIPVVIHDSTVDRTTNGKGFIRDYSFSEIQKLDAGYGRKISSLSEVLEFFKNENIIFHIELKEKNIAKIVEKIMYEHDLQKKVVLSAFDEDDTDEPPEYQRYCSCWKDLYDIQQKLPIALLATDKKINKMGLVNYIETAKNIKAYAVHPQHTSVDEEFVILAHNTGLKVNAWTVNNPDVYKEFLKYGVDGVFCDNPSFLVDN